MKRWAVTKVPPRVIKDIRGIHKYKGKAEHPYYNVEERPGTGNASCRNCGELITSNEPTIVFDWAPDSGRPWMKNRMSIHREDCGDNEKDWTTCPRCSDDIPNEEWPEHWHDHRYEKAASAEPLTLSNTTSGSAGNYSVTYTTTDFKGQTLCSSANTSTTTLMGDKMNKTAGHQEWYDMNIGEGEEREFNFPEEKPVTIPVEEPTEAPPAEVPEENPVYVPEKEPEKVPAGVGRAGKVIEAGDNAIGSGQGQEREHDTLNTSFTEDGHPVGYKSVNLQKRDDGQYVVVSPVQHLEWQRGPAKAECTQNHPPPGKGCGCGIYSLWDEKEAKRQYGNDHKSTLQVQLRASGRVIAPEQDVGMRCESASIIGLRSPGCSYCDMEGKVTPGSWMSQKGWVACDNHRKEWDDKIRDEESEPCGSCKGCEKSGGTNWRDCNKPKDPEVMPQWDDIHHIMKSVGSYYGADVYKAGEPMKYTPGYKPKEKEDAPAEGIDWDAAFNKELGGFQSHRHIGGKTSHCGQCAEDQKVQAPEVPKDRQHWRKVNDQKTPSGGKGFKSAGD